MCCVSVLSRCVTDLLLQGLSAERWEGGSSGGLVIAKDNVLLAGMVCRELVTQQGFSVFIKRKVKS